MQVTITMTEQDIACENAGNPGYVRLAGAFKQIRESMRTLLGVLAIGLLVPAALIMAQDKPTATSADKPLAVASAQDNPLSASQRRMYDTVKDWVLRSAEKMPEENYNFKPTEAVRSFGQIVGHVADVQNRFCALLRGEKNPGLKIEQNKTSKADLIAALKEAYTYCDKAYGSMTDASATQKVKFFGEDIPKLSVMTGQIAHTSLHYGNLVTYLRLKNIVPPSTEDVLSAQPKKP